MPPESKKTKGEDAPIHWPTPPELSGLEWNRAKSAPAYKPPLGRPIPAPGKVEAKPLPNFTPGPAREPEMKGFDTPLERGAGPEGGGGGSMDQLYTGEESPVGPSPQGMPEVYPNAEQRNAYAAVGPDPSVPAPPQRAVVGPEESRRVFQAAASEGKDLASLDDMYKARIAEATTPGITPGPTEPTASVKDQLQSAQVGSYHGRRIVNGVPEAPRDYSQEEMDQLLITDPRAHAQIMASHHDNLVKQIVAKEQAEAKARLAARGIVLPETPQGGHAHEAQVAAPAHVAQAAAPSGGGGSPAPRQPASHAPADHASGGFVGPKAPVEKPPAVDTSGIGKAIVEGNPVVQSAAAVRPATPQDRADQRTAAAAKVEARGQIGHDPSADPQGLLDYVPDFAKGAGSHLADLGRTALNMNNPVGMLYETGRNVAGIPGVVGEAKRFADSPGRYINQISPSQAARAGGALTVDAALGGATRVKGSGLPNVAEGMGDWTAKQAHPVGVVPYAAEAPKAAPAASFVEDLGATGPSSKVPPVGKTSTPPGPSDFVEDLGARGTKAKPSKPNPGAEAVKKAGGPDTVLKAANGEKANREAASLFSQMNKKSPPFESKGGALKGGKESPKALPSGKEAPPKGKATPMKGDAPSGPARPAGPAGSTKPKSELPGSTVGQKELPAPKKAKSMSSSSNKEGPPTGPVQKPSKMTVTEEPKKSWFSRFKNRGK